MTMMMMVMAMIALNTTVVTQTYWKTFSGSYVSLASSMSTK